MAILRQAGLVTARRDGKRILYSLRRDVLDRAARVLTRY
jgi:DNA-binding transcriptional ArsR family regulator